MQPIHPADLTAYLADRIMSRFLADDRTIKLLIAGLVSQSNTLISGPPGTGKSTAAAATCAAAGLAFGRASGNSDMWASDFVGQSVWVASEETFRFYPGPIFKEAMILDELGRVPQRAQAALLDAMNDGRVTEMGFEHRLSETFMLIATVNSDRENLSAIDPAVVDRFGLSIAVNRLTTAEERGLLTNPKVAIEEEDGERSKLALAALRAFSSQTHVSEEVVDYGLNLLAWIRLQCDGVPSTRAAVALIKVARAWALIDGRQYVTPDDVQALLANVVNHRVAYEPHLVQGAIESVRVL